MILLMGFGIRFVLYDEDGPNLDWVYRRYFGGRMKKNNARFSRTAGVIILLIVILYGVLLVQNGFAPLSGQLVGG